MWLEIGRMRISFMSFAVKDVALFYLNDQSHYVAFNRGCPHRYLSAESKGTLDNSQRYISLCARFCLFVFPNRLNLSPEYYFSSIKKKKNLFFSRQKVFSLNK